MISIFRSDYDSEINAFHGRPHVRRDEVVLKTKHFGGDPYTYAEPATPGRWAFGGTILYTSNGIFPEFNVPIKLHDRDMTKEG